jgi:hypothetical protein
MAGSLEKGVSVQANHAKEFPYPRTEARDQIVRPLADADGRSPLLRTERQHTRCHRTAWPSWGTGAGHQCCPNDRLPAVSSRISGSASAMKARRGLAASGWLRPWSLFGRCLDLVRSGTLAKRSQSRNNVEVHRPLRHRDVRVRRYVAHLGQVDFLPANAGAPDLVADHRAGPGGRGSVPRQLYTGLRACGQVPGRGRGHGHEHRRLVGGPALASRVRFLARASKSRPEAGSSRTLGRARLGRYFFVRSRPTVEAGPTSLVVKS